MGFVVILCGTVLGFLVERGIVGACCILIWDRYKFTTQQKLIFVFNSDDDASGLRVPNKPTMQRTLET